MRQLRFWGLALVGAALLTQCGPKKLTVETSSTEITVTNPYFQKWVGGREESGTGIDLYLPVKKPIGEVSLDSVWFRGVKAPIGKRREKADHIQFRAHYRDGQGTAFDTEKYVLGKNECLLDYTKDGKRHLLKIGPMAEKPAVNLP